MGAYDRDELAERIIKYSDSVAAFTILQFLGFLFALGNKDFHEAVLKAGKPIVNYSWWIVLIGTTFILFACGRAEIPLTRAAKLDALTLKYHKAVIMIRFGVIVIVNFAEGFMIHRLFG